MNFAGVVRAIFWLVYYGFALAAAIGGESFLGTLAAFAFIGWVLQNTIYGLGD